MSMPDENIIEWVREKYLAVVSDLGELGRRRWAAAEARSLGWGRVSNTTAQSFLPATTPVGPTSGGQ